jgi:TonB-dependent receptor
MIELNKTNSADMDADAPAGSINLKSKSAFQRKGRFFAWQTYALLNSYQLEFGKRDGPNDGRSYQMHLGANIDFSDVYLDGKFGVVVNLKETNSANEQAILNLVYNTVPTPTSPAPVALTTISYINGPKVNRRQAGGLNAEYKLGENAILAIRSQFNTEHVYIYNRQLQLITTRANQSAASNELLMVANPTTNNATRAATISANTMRRRTNVSFAPTLTYSGQRWELDATLAYTRAGEYINNGRRGQDLALRSTNFTLFGIGWTASRPAPDRTDWTFQQRSGPDMYQLQNWVPTSGTNNMIRTANEPLTKQYLAQANARLTTDWTLPTFLKGGIKSLETTYFNTSGSDSWTYVGPTGNRLQAELPISPYEFFNAYGGNLLSQKRIQMVDNAKLGTLLYEHPEYFTPNPTNATSEENLFPNRSAKEYIDSAYLMANTRIDRLTLQGGLRYEATKTKAVVYERRVAVERNGRYDDVFLSASGRYRFTDTLMAIASYGQSISRPTLPSKSTVATINETNLTGTFPNPNLKPENGNNYSARLEYYFEPVGVLSGGVFMMDVKDLIFTSAGVPAEEIGLGGEYPGYLFSTQGNADKFEIKGYELEYSQQLTFLPGAFRGIGIFANYARMQYSEQSYSYGRATETASAGLSFRYRGLNAALRASWTPDIVISRTTYTKERPMVGTSVDYRLTQHLSLFLTGRNIMNAGITTYRIDLPGYLQRDSKFGSNWAIGLKGMY